MDSSLNGIFGPAFIEGSNDVEYLSQYAPSMDPEIKGPSDFTMNFGNTGTFSGGKSWGAFNGTPAFNPAQAGSSASYMRKSREVD